MKKVTKVKTVKKSVELKGVRIKPVLAGREANFTM